MSRLKERLVPALLLGSALAIVPVAAWAHGDVESGSYVFEIGWIVEPVVVGERNGIDLFVAHHDDPEAGIPDLTTLQFTVEYGSASQAYDLVPDHDSPGKYMGEFIPTVVGQYTFHLSGTIEDESVEVTFEPEEVVAASGLEFPQTASPATDTSTRTLALAGVVLGVVGVGLGAFSLMRKK